MTTEWLPGAAEGSHAGEAPAWERVRAEVAAGHRAFVVCPLVGDSPRVEAKSAAEEFERLSNGELTGLRVGLLHGQMASAAREEVMAQFRRGELEVLVATTVIEVGVDVPEATVMVIESADRFGIAQLHQLRGRVGRGTRGQLVLSCSAARRTTSGWLPWRVRPTAFIWPRWTCGCAARARSSALARRGRATSGWRPDRRR